MNEDIVGEKRFHVVAAPCILIVVQAISESKHFLVYFKVHQCALKP